MEVKVYPIKKEDTEALFKETTLIIKNPYYFEPDLNAEPRLGVIQKYFTQGVVIAFDDGTLDVVSYKLIRHNLGE